MEKLFNLSIYSLDWFDNDWSQVLDFCRQQELAGVELLADGFEDYEAINEIPAKLVKGLHLSYYLNWLPLEVGIGRQRKQEEIINNYRRQLKLARELEVDYVVFHASNTGMQEILSGEFKYDNSVILAEVAKIINEVVTGLDIEFKLLFENLWWRGLTFLDKKEAVGFLQQIDYENLGFLLDTGHLMNTNLDLNDEVEGIKYIKEVLADFQGSIELFYGIHLHKSLSSSYRQKNREKFYDKFQKADSREVKEKLVERFIANSDQHLPFDVPSLLSMVEFIDPAYLIHEFTCAKKEKFIDYLRTQDSNL